MADEVKTKAIPALLNEAKETGLISEAAQEALEAEKLQAQERIEHIRTLCERNLISEVQKEAAIAGIEEELRKKIIDLNLHNI